MKNPADNSKSLHRPNLVMRWVSYRRLTPVAVTECRSAFLRELLCRPNELNMYFNLSSAVRRLLVLAANSGFASNSDWKSSCTKRGKNLKHINLPKQQLIWQKKETKNHLRYMYCQFSARINTIRECRNGLTNYPDSAIFLNYVDQCQVRNINCFEATLQEQIFIL